MLNKVLVAKFVTAMTLAGLATGAAAGFDGDDPADDGETIELEIPFSADDESTTSDDTTTEDESEEADDSEADEDADESSEAAVEEPKAPTHGSIVSACARGTEETGKAKGQAVSAVAKDDTVPCAGLSEQSAGDEEEAPAPAEDADEADADDEDADDDEAGEEPRAAKAQGADHRNGKANEMLAGRDARKAGR